MGIGQRIAQLYEIKVNALLDRAEDPGEALDYSYTRQQEMLLRIRRARADVAAAREQAAMHESQLRRTAARLQRQARQAVAAGQEGLARQALALRTATLAQAGDMKTEQAALGVDEDKLSAAEHRLRAKTEAFGVHKEAVKARYAAARAAMSGGRAFGGIWEEMGEVDLATRRAEDTIARLAARASALGDLIASGELTDATGLAGPEVTGLAGGAEIQAQLDAISTRAAVEDELARIKAQLTAEASQPRGARARGRRAATARTPPGKPAPPDGDES